MAKKQRTIKNINTMKTKIDILDFRFSFAGYGHYTVKYCSPVTGKVYEATTNNMPLIDATKNADRPKIKDLIELKRLCKSN